MYGSTQAKAWICETKVEAMNQSACGTVAAYPWLVARDEVEQQTLEVSGEVKAWMARRNVKQEALATALGITQPSLSMRLRGRTRWTIQDLVIVSKTLDVPVSVLLAPLER
jgi:predicted XRE-type DNA-binding protein